MTTTAKPAKTPAAPKLLRESQSSDGKPILHFCTEYGPVSVCIQSATSAHISADACDALTINNTEYTMSCYMEKTGDSRWIVRWIGSEIIRRVDWLSMPYNKSHPTPAASSKAHELAKIFLPLIEARRPELFNDAEESVTRSKIKALQHDIKRLEDDIAAKKREIGQLAGVTD